METLIATLANIVVSLDNKVVFILFLRLMILLNNNNGSYGIAYVMQFRYKNISSSKRDTIIGLVGTKIEYNFEGDNYVFA